MRAIFSKVAKSVGLSDLHAYGGLVLVAGGVWLWLHPPAALVVAGAGLIYFAHRM